MLHIDKLSVKYPDGNQVLNQLNFTIKDGETVGIIGANGAGKSTLLMSIVGVLLPSEGRIVIDELEVNKKNIKEVREKVGMVFQNPDNQLFMSNIYDDIAFGLRNYGMNEVMVQKKINEIMNTLDIEKLMNHHSNRLSGGEKRIAAIATVLVMEPSIVLFDEPTSFLDPRMRRKLITLLKEMKMAKLIATHDLDMTLEICDRVIVLQEGKVLVDGNARDILTNEELLMKAGLELPFCLQKIPT